MKETIETVTAWANETFGDAPVHSQIVRAMQEMDELYERSANGYESNDDLQRIAEEAADVCICLYRIIGTIDPRAIEKKMAINRGRTWKLHGDGTAQHE